MALSKQLTRGVGILRSGFTPACLRDLNLDDPRTTERRREIIQANSFLRRIYGEWYSLLSDRIPPGSDRVLE